MRLLSPSNVQEVAALSGHASQAQRSARIAAQLSDEPRAAVGAVSPPPSGVGTTLHVSLRELHEGHLVERRDRENGKGGSCNGAGLAGRVVEPDCWRDDMAAF